MVRQFGCPTFFLTCSAAESKWPELIKILKEVLEVVVITLEGAETLPYAEKTDLVSRSPVARARYFDHKMRYLFKVLSSPAGPFKENRLIDIYMRVEFQHRGRPHIQSLLWLTDPPQFNFKSPDSISTCIDFVDK
jgi:hypothetical protein